MSKKQYRNYQQRELKLAETYKYVNQEVTREITEYCEAVFCSTTFDSFGI